MASQAIPGVGQAPSSDFTATFGRAVAGDFAAPAQVDAPQPAAPDTGVRAAPVARPPGATLLQGAAPQPRNAAQTLMGTRLVAAPAVAGVAPRAGAARADGDVRTSGVAAAPHVGAVSATLPAAEVRGAALVPGDGGARADGGAPRVGTANEARPAASSRGTTQTHAALAVPRADAEASSAAAADAIVGDTGAVPAAAIAASRTRANGERDVARLLLAAAAPGIAEALSDAAFRLRAPVDASAGAVVSVFAASEDGAVVSRATSTFSLRPPDASAGTAVNKRRRIDEERAFGFRRRPRPERYVQLARSAAAGTAALRYDAALRRGGVPADALGARPTFADVIAPHNEYVPGRRKASRGRRAANESAAAAARPTIRGGVRHGDGDAECGVDGGCDGSGVGGGDTVRPGIVAAAAATAYAANAGTGAADSGSGSAAVDDGDGSSDREVTAGAGPFAQQVGRKRPRAPVPQTVTGGFTRATLRPNLRFRGRPPGGVEALTPQESMVPLFTYPEPVAYGAANAGGLPFGEAVAAAAAAAAAAEVGAHDGNHTELAIEQRENWPADGAAAAAAPSKPAVASPPAATDSVAAAAAARVAAARRAPGSVNFTLGDHAHLDLGAYLNDSDIDWWMTYMFTRRTVDDAHRSRVYFASAFFFRHFALSLTKRTAGGRSTPDVQRYRGWAAVRRWIAKVDLFDKDFMFAPVGSFFHWSLLVAANLKQLGALLRERDTEIRAAAGRPIPGAAAANEAAAPASAKASATAAAASANDGDAIVIDGDSDDDRMTAEGHSHAAAARVAGARARRTRIDPDYAAWANLSELSEKGAMGGGAALRGGALRGAAAPRGAACSTASSLLVAHAAPEAASAPAPPWVTSRPVLLFMDSLKTHNRVAACDEMRALLQNAWEDTCNHGERVGGQPRVLRRGEAPDFILSRDDMPSLSPPVTEQKNGCDCGVFVLKYAELLLALTTSCVPSLGGEAAVPAGPFARGVPTAVQESGFAGVLHATDFTPDDAAALRIRMQSTAEAFADSPRRLWQNSVPRDVVAEYDAAQAGDAADAASAHAEYVAERMTIAEAERSRGERAGGAATRTVALHASRSGAGSVVDGGGGGPIIAVPPLLATAAAAADAAAAPRRGGARHLGDGGGLASVSVALQRTGWPTDSGADAAGATVAAAAPSGTNALGFKPTTASVPAHAAPAPSALPSDAAPRRDLSALAADGAVTAPSTFTAPAAVHTTAALSLPLAGVAVPPVLAAGSALFVAAGPPLTHHDAAAEPWLSSLPTAANDDALAVAPTTLPAPAAMPSASAPARVAAAPSHDAAAAVFGGGATVATASRAPVPPTRPALRLGSSHPPVVAAAGTQPPWRPPSTRPPPVASRGSAAAAASGAAASRAAGATPQVGIATRRGGATAPTISSAARAVTRGDAATAAAAVPAVSGGIAGAQRPPPPAASAAADAGESGADARAAFAAATVPQLPLWQTCRALLPLSLPSPRLRGVVELETRSNGDCAPLSLVASLLASSSAALASVDAGGAGAAAAAAQLPILAFAASVVLCGDAAPAVAPLLAQADARTAVARFVDVAQRAATYLRVGAAGGASLLVHDLFPHAAQQLRAWAARHVGQSLIAGGSAVATLAYDLRLQLLASADVVDATAFYNAAVEVRALQLERWCERVRIPAPVAAAAGMPARDYYFSDALVVALASLLGLRARVHATAYAWRVEGRGVNWSDLSPADRASALRRAPVGKVIQAWAFPGYTNGAASDVADVDFVLHGSHFTPLVTRAQLDSVERAIGAPLCRVERRVPLLVGPDAADYLVGPGFTTHAF